MRERQAERRTKWEEIEMCRMTGKQVHRKTGEREGEIVEGDIYREARGERERVEGARQRPGEE